MDANCVGTHRRQGALDQWAVVAGARELFAFLGIFAISLGAIVAALGIVQWRRVD